LTHRKWKSGGRPAETVRGFALLCVSVFAGLSGDCAKASSREHGPLRGDFISPRRAEAARPPAQPRNFPELRANYPPRSLCDRQDIPDGTRLTHAAIDSTGRYFSDFNVSVLATADSLYRAGVFGPVGENDSRRGARRYFQIYSWNAIKTISDLTERGLELARVDGDGHMDPLLSDFMNGAMYPLRHIDRARLGADGFCMRYNIPTKYKESFKYGGAKITVEAKEVKIDGEKTRVLSREWIDGKGDKIELYFKDVFCGRVVREEIMDRGDRLELTTFFDMEGLHVHRHGTHHVSAMISWRSVPEEGKVIENPRIGAAAYFPRIKVELPIFLPDIGVEDLRDFAYPPPLMVMDAFLSPEAYFPDWIEAVDSGQLKDWETVGPMPLILSERFPDL